MPVDAPPSASDSSDNINLQPQLNGTPERGVANNPQLKRVQDESRSIIDLVFKKTKNALDVIISEQGGSRMVWAGLDQSGYKSFREFYEDVVNSVTALHAKLVARENLVSGEVTISQGELDQTLHNILLPALASQGVGLQSDLAGLKMHKTV